MSDLLPAVRELPSHVVRRVAELHHDEHLRAVLDLAAKRINVALREREATSLYRAQGAAAFLTELETLLLDANNALLKR